MLVEVYFDDFKITHTKSPVIAAQDYYPFGLTFNSYQRENSVKEDYLYNGKEQQDELNLGWLDYGARMYMPDIGRWTASDPLAEKAMSWTPYRYGFNNPLRFTDPDGMFEYSDGYGTHESGNESGAVDHWGTFSNGDISSSMGKSSSNEFSNKMQNWLTNFNKKNEEIFGEGQTQDGPGKGGSGNLVIHHGAGFDLIIESFTEKTSIGERDSKNSALVIYDKHGNTTDVVLKRKVNEWNLLGWYQGENPQQTRVDDLMFSDLSIQMIEAIITSSDYHCQGCILGPVLVPVKDRWFWQEPYHGNRLNATSSGTSSRIRNSQQPPGH